MKLEADSVLYVLRYSISALYELISREVIRSTATVYPLRAFVSQFCKIVSLELNSVDFIISAKFLYLLQALFLRHLILAVLVARELLKEVLFCIFLSPFLFRSKFLWYREERHDRVTFYIICLYLVENLKRVAQGLRNVCENLIHLSLSLEPLLLRISHTVRVVQVLTR